MPLPGLMTCELIGVPFADRDEFREWVAAFMSVTALTTEQRQARLLRDRPELVPNAVEELLRWVPLAATAEALPRYALADVRLSGGTVPAGDAILVARHTANRDPRMYPDPDRLPGLHLAAPADRVPWRTGMAVRAPIALPVGW